MTLRRFKVPVAPANAEDTIECAARTMRERHVGALVVTRDGRPVGLLTDRDIVVRVVAEGRDATRQSVASCLTYDPITVSIHEGAETAAERMRRHGVRRLPLVDDEGRLVGIVTADDLLVLLGRQISAVCEGIENRVEATESR